MQKVGPKRGSAERAVHERACAEGREESCRPKTMCLGGPLQAWERCFKSAKRAVKLCITASSALVSSRKVAKIGHLLRDLLHWSCI